MPAFGRTLTELTYLGYQPDLEELSEQMLLEIADAQAEIQTCFQRHLGRAEKLHIPA